MATSLKSGNTHGRVKHYPMSRFTEISHTFNLSDFATESAIVDLWAADRALGGFDLTAACGSDFFGLPTTENEPAQIAAMVALGSNDLVSRVERARTEAAGINVARVLARKPTFAGRRVTGQRFDLEAVLSGDPLPWGRWEPGPQRAGSRIVSLYVSLGADAMVNPDAFAWSSVAGIVAADLLEQAGYRVEIWGVDRANQQNFTITSMRVGLKGASDPLDVSALVRTAHPAVARGVIMPLSRKVFGDKLHHGYGQTMPINPAVFGEPEAIVVRHTYGLADCLAEIRRVVAKFQE